MQESDAVGLAQEALGRSQDDSDRPWKLKEFSQGWLVSQAPVEGRRGAAMLVIERDSGRLVRFASAVPPGRILTEYEQVRSRGVAEAGPEERTQTV